MKFMEWLLKGTSDTIHNWAFLYTLIIVGGIFSIGVAFVWVMEGRWLQLSLGIFTVLYGLYYFEERARKGEETNE